MKVLNSTEDLLWQADAIYLLATIGALVCFMLLIFVVIGKTNKYSLIAFILIYIVSMILLSISLNKDHKDLKSSFSDEKSLIVDDYRLKSNKLKKFIFFKDDEFKGYKYIVFDGDSDINSLFKDSKIKYKVNEKYKTVLVVDIDN